MSDGEVQPAAPSARAPSPEASFSYGRPARAREQVRREGYAQDFDSDDAEESSASSDEYQEPTRPAAVRAHPGQSSSAGTPPAPPNPFFRRP